MSEPHTKERILDAGVKILLERSFHSVGLNQLLSSVKVPKGSFYHYFKSKEDFGVEVLRYYSQNANSKRREILSDLTIAENPVQRMIYMLNAAIEQIQANNCKCPCLLQKVAIEIANTSEPMRTELVNGFNQMIEIFQQVLRQAIAGGFLPETLDTLSEAQLILDLWAGAQQRTAIIRQTTPLRNVVSLLEDRLLQKA